MKPTPTSQPPNTQQRANNGQKEPFRRVGYSPSARLRDNFMPPDWEEKDPYQNSPYRDNPYKSK